MRARSLLAFVLLFGCSKGGDEGGGGGLIDRGSCDVLIECASDLAPESRDQFEAAYGQGGTCWTGGPESWALCRDACRDSLDALNLTGQVSGQTCGTCESDSDCAASGANATCDEGLCVGGDPDGGTGGGTSETGGDTGGPGCTFETSPECLRLVSCIGAIAPSQQDALEAMYGENGSCWCGTEAEAMSCNETCVDELATAIEQFPTVSECQDGSCSLDPSAPYGPVTDGACPDYRVGPQLPLVEPFDVAGSVCAPECIGVANTCPQHPQTAAEGTCFVAHEGKNYCVARCWVDPAVVDGNQCQCGATCQPYGPLDPDGHARGICTFE